MTDIKSMSVTSPDPCVLVRKIRQLQLEQVPWREHNFPGSHTLEPLVGIVEELGELAEAIADTPLSDRKDAIADVLIYLCDYCHRIGLDVSKPFDMWRGGSVRWDPMIVVGKIAHHGLKLQQGIRGKREEHVDAIIRWVTHLLEYLAQWGDDIEGVAWDTWRATVSKRDWQADPKSGVAG